MVCKNIEPLQVPGSIWGSTIKIATAAPVAVVAVAAVPRVGGRNPRGTGVHGPSQAGFGRFGSLILASSVIVDTGQDHENRNSC